MPIGTALQPHNTSRGNDLQQRPWNMTVSWAKSSAWGFLSMSSGGYSHTPTTLHVFGGCSCVRTKLASPHGLCRIPACKVLLHETDSQALRTGKSPVLTRPSVQSNGTVYTNRTVEDVTSDAKVRKLLQYVDSPSQSSALILGPNLLVSSASK